MKSTLKTGAITGIVSCVFLYGFFSLMVWLNGKNNWGLQVSTIRGIGGLLSIPVQAIGIYIAMQNVKQARGSLTYGQAVKTGLTVAITIAVLVALFGFIYCTFLNPGYAEFMVRDAQKAMLARGESQRQIDNESADVAKQFSTGAQVMMGLVGQFVSGAITSLIIGIFIKTKQNA